MNSFLAFSKIFFRILVFFFLLMFCKVNNSMRIHEIKFQSFLKAIRQGKNNLSLRIIFLDQLNRQTIGNKYISYLLSRIESEEQSNLVITQIQQIIKNCFENVSVEVIQDWLFILYLIWQQNDVRKVQALLTPILDSFKLTDPSFKLNRYIAIYRLLCRNYGQFFPQYSENALTLFLEFKSAGVKQVFETCQLLIEITQLTYMLPISYSRLKHYGIISDLETIHDTSLYFQSNLDIYYLQCPKLNDCFDYISNQLNSEDTDQRKTFIIMAIRLVSSLLHGQVVHYYLYSLVKPLIQFHIEFKEEMIPEQSLIQSLNQNISLIGMLKMEVDVQQNLQMMLEENMRNNKNWRSRVRAINAFHLFYFNNIFHSSGIKPDLALFECLGDSHQAVQQFVFNALSDLVKLSTKQELETLIQKYSKLAEISIQEGTKEEDQQQKAIAVYALMTVLLAFPNEIYPWTEKVLQIVLRNHKIIKNSNDKIRAFCAKFWKNKVHWWAFYEIQLDSDLLQTIREKANYYNYFA